MLPSMPGDILPLNHPEDHPVSVAKEGRNYFRVEARLEESSARVRPGMEGIGKVVIEERQIDLDLDPGIAQLAMLQVWTWMAVMVS